MIHAKTKKVCMTMRDIYSNSETRAEFPSYYLRSKLLVDEVFDKSVFENIEFIFVRNESDKSIIFDTDYASLRWSMIPTLINIAANCVDETGRSFIPVMIDWSDKTEDDDLAIVCADQRSLDKEYRLTESSSVWDRVEDDDEDDVNSWFAIIDGDEIYFEKVDLEDFRSAANTKIDNGYEPLLIQRVVDDEDEGSICYWMMAPKKKIHKVKRHRVSLIKR